MGLKPIGTLVIVVVGWGLLAAPSSAGTFAAPDDGGPLTRSERLRSCLEAARRLEDGGQPLPISLPHLADGGVIRPAICGRPDASKFAPLARVCGGRGCWPLTSSPP